MFEITRTIDTNRERLQHTFKLLELSISNILQILGLQLRFSKVFLDHQNIFFSQQVRTVLVTKYLCMATCICCIRKAEINQAPKCVIQDAKKEQEKQQLGHLVLQKVCRQRLVIKICYKAKYYTRLQFKKYMSDH